MTNQLDGDDDITSPIDRAPRARVLVVDDDPLSRDVVGTRLRRDGYDVYEASNGDEALAMVDDVDLLVLDIHMPGRSGITILRELRRRHCAIPTLLVTGSPNPGLYTMANVLEARVLLKPIALDRLSDAAIRSILARQQA